MKQQQLLIILGCCLLQFSGLQAQQTDSTFQIPYGEQDRHFSTGAITQIAATRFNSGIITDWNQLWQGLVPGMAVARPGSDPNRSFEPRIRNLHSFDYRTTPLYVIDGVPGVDPQNIDPSAITSVTVLRDAASTAMYGGRGAAGVVLISTKPSLSKGLRVNYSGMVSLASDARRYKVLNEAAFVRNGGSDFSQTDVVDTDWQDQVLRSAASHVHSLNLSTSNGKGGYVSTNFSYRKVDGILKKSGFEQFGGTMNFGQKFWADHLQLSGGLSLNSRNADIGFVESYRYAVLANPTHPVKTDDPAFEAAGGYFNPQLFDYYNPVAILEQSTNKGVSSNLMGNFRADLQIWKGLRGAVMVSRLQNNLKTGEYYDKQGNFRGRGRNGFASAINNNRQQDLLESTLNYDADLSRLHIALLGGYSWQRNSETHIGIEAGNVLTNAFQNNNLGAFNDFSKGLASVSSSQAEQTLIGFFGRAQLQWNKTYFLDLGARKDGASQLGENGKWGLFPSLGAGIDVAQLMPMRRFDQLKIRVAHGVSGMAPQQSALSKNAFSAGYGTFYYNGSYIPWYGLIRNENKDLSWERYSETSVGLDFSMFKNRLYGSVDLFRYTSSDLIRAQTVPVPPNVASTTYVNYGEISGQGTEISLNLKAVENQQLSWDLGLVMSNSKSTLEKFSPDIDMIRTASPSGLCGCDTYYELLSNGETIGTYFGLQTTGVINPSGELVYVDVNGDGQVIPYDASNSDFTTIGDAQPSWDMGLQQTLRWRKFELNMLFRGVMGHQLVHEFRVAYESNNLTSSTWNRVATRYYDEKNRSINRFSDRFVENASFLRLQNLTLSYHFGLKANSGLQQLQVQAGAQNLFTLSKYTGLDPEIRLSDGGGTSNAGRTGGYALPYVMGIDRLNTYPLARTWWVGVKAAF